MLSRRSMLISSALGVTAAALPLTGASAAEAEEPGLPIPETLSRLRTLPGGPVEVPSTPFPLTQLGLDWTGDGEVGVRLLTENSGWGEWQSVHGCEAGFGDGEELPAPAQRGGLLSVPQAVGYELATNGNVGEIRVAELNTVDGPVSHIAPPHARFLRLDGKLTPVRYYSRAAWGADESLRLRPDGSVRWPPAYYPVQTLTVHHTGQPNDYTDPVAYMRALYHTECKSDGDFIYHLAIDEHGSVYEGRYSGADNSPVFGPNLGADGRPMMVNAAHIGGWNAGNVSVVLLGNFSKPGRLPTDEQYRSLRLVLRLLARVLDLDVESIANYVNPVNGARKTVYTLGGHRDWAPTECPGNNFYPFMDALRRDVGHGS